MNEAAKKADRRTLYTRAVVKDALLALMASRDYAELTIADLCRTAEISRSTFYRHYSNLRQVIDDLFADARDEIARPGYLGGLGDEEAPRHMCLFLRKNRKYLPLFMSPHFRGEAVAWFINSEPKLREWLMSEGRSMKYDELQNIMFFQLNGCLALVQEKLDVPDEEWLRIKTCVDAFLKRGMGVDQDR